jgi:hypothetical protein
VQPGSAGANAINRTTTVSGNATVASGTGLVNAGIHDANARGTYTRTWDTNIACRTGLVNPRINDTNTRCANPYSPNWTCHAAFRHPHTLAIHCCIRGWSNAHKAQQCIGKKSIHHFFQYQNVRSGLTDHPTVQNFFITCA